MEAPLREIVTNAGEDPSVVLNKVKDGKGSYGYNAANGEYGDMIEFGILDPTKVTRTALQNATSIAVLMITTEAMVAEVPKKDDGGCPDAKTSRPPPCLRRLQAAAPLHRRSNPVLVAALAR